MELENIESHVPYLICSLRFSYIHYVPSGLKFIPLTPGTSEEISFDCLNSKKAKALE